MEGRVRARARDDSYRHQDQHADGNGMRARTLDRPSRIKMLQREDEAPPPLPPSRSASIRSELSPASNNPPPPRPRPRPRPPVDNSDAPNSSTTSHIDESASKIAALREAVFGEKRGGPPPVLQKSTKKASFEERGSAPSGAHHNETQKSSVLRIAATLESSKHDVDNDIQSDKLDGKKMQVDRHQQQATSNCQPSQPPTPSLKQTRSRNVNQLSTINQQTEHGLLRPGAPYEVPKQGSVIHHTGDSNHDDSSLSEPVGSEQRRFHATQSHCDPQSSLVSSLQSALAKQNLSRKSSLTNDSETSSHSATLPAQHSPSDAQACSQEGSPDVNSSKESNLLERIRKRKAQRNNKYLLSDNSAIETATDPNSKVQKPESISPANSDMKLNQFAEHNFHSNKPPLPDPAAGDSPRDGHRSLLRRSSSSLSSRRSNNDNAMGTIIGDGSKRSGHRLQRSPSSVSQHSNDDTILRQSDGHTNSRHKALHRSPSNVSRRSSDESVPQLPPRSYIKSGDSRQQDQDGTINSQVTDQNHWEQEQTSNASSKPRRQSTGRNLLVRPQIGNQSVTNTRKSNSSEESMVLSDFISRYSGALPLAVSIQDANSVSSKQLIATRPCNNFNVHFVKHSKVVIIHDCFGGECFSVPLNSSVRFGLIYDQSSEGINGSYFETAGEIMSLKQLPYVICATKQYDGGSHEKSVEAGEILFVRGVKKPKAIGRGKVLKVNSIHDDEKTLSSKCCGGFTTAPNECQLNLSTMMAHSIPFPQQAMMFGEIEVTTYLPQTMTAHPVTLEKIRGESSVVMTPRFDMIAQEDESWTYDVSTEVKLWVRKLPLSEEDQQDLNTVTNVYYNSFDPLYTQHYAEKSDANGIALQHVLCINTIPGKEKEGVHLYLPNANMMQQQMSGILSDIHADQTWGMTHILSEHEMAPANDSTYALHITEQRRKNSGSLTGQDKRKGTTSSSTQHSETSSYIPPDESSDVEQEDEDGCEETYEEVMSTLEPVEEEQLPTGSGNVAKLAGMFKSIKHPLTVVPKEEKHQLESTQDDLIETASPSPEPEEDYDKISFCEDITEEEDHPCQSEHPPPLPDTSQIIGRRPPQMAPPPPPPEQGAPQSIALQRLMAAAKITSSSAASVIEEEEQEGYQPVRVDEEMFEDEESGYSDVRSLDIPSIIADKQSSIAAALNKRKPLLPPRAKEESSGIKPSGHSASSSNADDTELAVQAVEQSSRHPSRRGSVEGDYMRLRGLYSGLQTQISQMMDEMNRMKAHIEELSHTVEELVQAKDGKQDSVHPSKTQTLPRKRKVAKNK